MKKNLLLMCSLFLLFQIGCTKAVRYTEEEIKRFPQVTQENIRKGTVDLGMTQEQVRYAWGSPDSIKHLDPYDGKFREEWMYSQAFGTVGVKILFFFDNKLIYIK
jgi:outer membrane protein assembly factor BamE (lipoprotein component of BamABCDE complex)